MADSSKPPLRVGIVTTWIESAYWTVLISGLVDGLREAGAHVLCFTLGLPGRGGATASDATDPFYELCTSESVSGLVVLSSASFSQASEEFCDRRRGLPMVSVGQRVPGVPSVWMHNAAGIRKMVDHLVDNCGRRRIAFIRGPEANGEAEARFRAYEDMCVERSLSLESTLVEMGNFTESSGQRAAERLLERNQSTLPDAIMAANDLMARGAERALRNLALRVPDDIAVVGFDDLEASLSDPPLTTVRQPVYELGKRAAELLLAQLRGETVPEHVLFPPEIVVRASCGCTVSEVTSAAELVSRHRAGAPRLFAGQQKEPAEGSGSDEVLPLVQALRQEVLPNLRHKPDTQGRVARILEAIEILARDSASEALNYQRAIETARKQALTRIRWRTTHATNLPALLEHLAEILPALNIDGFFVSLFEGRPGPIDTARLVFAYHDGREIPVQPGGANFPARRLVPGYLARSAPSGTSLVHPLETDGALIGFVIMHGEVYDAQLLSDVCHLLSAALDRLQALNGQAGLEA
ncbi:LacI family DNA-binding transcriptional regulator [Myxococcota bacterium]